MEHNWSGWPDITPIGTRRTNELPPHPIPHLRTLFG